MKKLFTLALAIFTISLFVGCDDPKGGEDGPDNASIIGKWDAMRADGREVIGGKETDSWSETYLPGEVIVTFSPDGKGMMSEDGVQEAFSYTLSGKTLKISNSEMTLTLDIRKLTDKELELFSSVDEGDGAVYETYLYLGRK